MANPEQLAKLKRSIGFDVGQRRQHDHTRLKFDQAELANADLRGADLSFARLNGAKLTGANLGRVDLTEAILSEADLREADLSNADLSLALLYRTNLSGAKLLWANLNGAILDGTDLSGAEIGYTVFGDVDLSRTAGLESVIHRFPSTIGIDTIYRSKGKIPRNFLHGAGVPEDFIQYMASLVGKGIEFYSLFISYSTKDQEFAERLHADLQAKGVRCWFAPEDMPGGRSSMRRSTRPSECMTNCS